MLSVLGFHVFAPCNNTVFEVQIKTKKKTNLFHAAVNFHTLIFLKACQSDGLTFCSSTSLLNQGWFFCMLLVIHIVYLFPTCWQVFVDDCWSLIGLRNEWICLTALKDFLMLGGENKISQLRVLWGTNALEALLLFWMCSFVKILNINGRTGSGADCLRFTEETHHRNI